MENILSIRKLNIAVNTKEGERLLISNVDLDVPAFSITAIVGGSGSGKTTTGLSVLRLLPQALEIKSGEIIFQGEDVLIKREVALRKMRGKEISMIFQEPLSAFNPVMSVGSQILEVLRVHTDLSTQKSQDRVLELLDIVGIKNPKVSALSYPHQLSGGMRQRAMIAQAIAGNPKLIIADEPTSNLDVSLQAKIMDLFLQLKDQLKLSILLISHDLDMVSHLADHVAIMNQGRVVEYGKPKEIMGNPKNKYTQSLMEAFKV